MVSVRLQQNNASGMSMHSVRLVFPCHLFNVNGTRNAAEMFAPAVVFGCYILFLHTPESCATNYKTRWFLTLVTAPKHRILSLSLSLHRTHSPSRDSPLAA